jgi:prepilin-type N-terminal cleavage/methylation domain-containing protein
MAKKIVKKSDGGGFSLIELLVVAAVFLVVLGIAAQLIQLANFDVRTTRNLVDVEQQARSALKYLNRDVNNSGQGYLQGDASGGVNGPLICITTLQNLTGLANLPPLPAPIITPANSQQFFCLVPNNKPDNLGNGAGVMGMADRLTASYVDEFFTSGTSTVTDSTTMAIISQVTLTSFVGTWTRAARSLNVTNPAPAPNSPMMGQTTTVVYNINSLKPGDILLISSSVLPTPILAMVSSIDTVNNKVFFADDALRFNQLTPGPAPDPTNLAPANQAILYPLDRLIDSPPLPMPAITFNATKVNIYSYQVDPTSRSLLRRRYTFQPNGTPVGNAFLNDPMCENVERFWFTYNSFVPGVGGGNPTLGPDLPIDPNADTTQYAKLQQIRRVNVNLIVRSMELDRRNAQPARFCLQSSFDPRNVSYSANENIK